MQQPGHEEEKEIHSLRDLLTPIDLERDLIRSKYTLSLDVRYEENCSTLDKKKYRTI